MRITSHFADDRDGSADANAAPDCAKHSYGEVQKFFRQNPCTALNRALYVLCGRNGEDVLLAVAWVEMENVEKARRLQSVLDRPGSGNLTELSRKRPEYRTVRYDNATYTSRRDGSLVTNAQVRPVRGTSSGMDSKSVARDAVR